MILKSGRIRKSIIISLIVFGVLIMGGLVSGYYFFLAKDKTTSPVGKVGAGSGTGGGSRLVNPAEGLSIEEAVKKFDGSFVAYILISIGAYNLHPPMFGSDTPKIEFYIWDEKYNAEIIDGKINVQKGEIAERDIIIWTSAEEAVKMVKDKNYISESFKTGASKVELVAGKIELAMKGYISLYDELTG